MSLQRLRHRAQFDAVLGSPPAAKTMHFALHLANPLAPDAASALWVGPGPWLGVMLPKRWAKRAVTRNLLRRQIYALGTELLPTLPSRAMVVRLRKAYAREQFPSASSDALKRLARQELTQLFGRLARA
jgi:ribonuclease P protein component